MTEKPPGKPGPQIEPDRAVENLHASAEGWRQTFSAMTGMGLTKEQRERWRLEKQCRRCEKNVDYLMKYSGGNSVLLSLL